MRRSLALLLGLAGIVLALGGAHGVAAASGCGPGPGAGPAVTSWSDGSVADDPHAGTRGDGITFRGSFNPVQGEVDFVPADGTAAVVMTVSAWSGSQVTAAVPSGIVSSGSFQVCDGFNAAVVQVPTGFSLLPGIDQVTPGSGAFEGQTVTISGYGFTPGGSSVSIGGQPATLAPGSSWTSLSVRAPAVTDPCSPQEIRLGAATYRPGSGEPAVEANTSRSLLVPPFVDPQKGFNAPPSPTAGQNLTVSGSGLAGAQVTFGGHAIQPVVRNDTAVVFPLPADIDSGQVAVQVCGTTFTSASTFRVLPVISALNPTSVTAGEAITATGTNLGGSGTLTWGDGEVKPVDGGWSESAVTFKLPPGSVPDRMLTLTRSDGASVVAPHVDLVQAITGYDPHTGPPGQFVTIVGTTFGVSRGAGGVKLNGQTVPILLWSDTTIGVTIPTGATTGDLSVTTAYGKVLVAGTFTVPPPGSPQATPAPASGGGSPIGSGHTGIVPPLPITFHLAGSSLSGHPGDTITLSVTMLLNGAPIPGAPVNFTIVSSPVGSHMKTDSVVTDANGVASADLVTSALPGTTIALASSGGFSDQVSVVTGSAAGAPQGVTGGRPAGQGSLGSLFTRLAAQFAGFHPSGATMSALLATAGALALLIAGISIQVSLRRRSPRRPRTVRVVDDLDDDEDY